MSQIDDHYSVPSFPVSSFNQALQESLEQYLTSLEKKELVDFAIQNVRDENNLIRQFQEWSTQCRWEFLCQELGIELKGKDENMPIADWVVLLMQMTAKSLVRFQIDQRVMDDLAKSDPGVYAKVLLTRHKFSSELTATDKYRANLLMEYSGKSSGGSSHSAWNDYVVEQLTRPFSLLPQIASCYPF